MRKIERDVERISGERSALARTIGRVEGSLSVAKEHKEKVAQEPYVKVPREDLMRSRAKWKSRRQKNLGTPDALFSALVCRGQDD